MRKIAGAVLSNLFNLLIALAIAILIWVNALRIQDPMRSELMTIPVVFVGQPDNSILINPLPERRTVQISFEGPTSIVTQLTASDFSATVDLSGVPFGTQVPVPVNVQPNDPQVTLLSSPEQISVELEQLVTRDIPVRLDLRGDVARGHVKGDPLVDPEVITVSGPASSVESLDFARTTVFLNDDRETVVDSRQPIFYDRQGRVASVRGLTLSTEQVDVTIPVTELSGFAEKFIDADLVGEPAPGYRVLDINFNPPSVLVKGLPTQLGQLNRVSTEPIDITGLTESHTQRVALALPPGVTLDEVEEIFVEIVIEPFFTTDTYNPMVTVQGLGEGLEAIVEPEAVRVVLFGPLPALEALLDEEVGVSVDLFGLITGTYSLEPDVTYPDRGIELRSIQPSLVSVNITRLLTITNRLTGTLPITESFSNPSTDSVVSGRSHPITSSPVHRQPAVALTPSPLHLPRRITL